MRDVRDALMVARNSDGKLIRRPLSPTFRSIVGRSAWRCRSLHRVTGVGLGIGTLLLTWWLVAAAISDGAFATVQWFLATPIGMLLLFGWTLALFFHFFAGIRHLVWDAGYGFEQPWYERSAWAVVIATVRGDAAAVGHRPRGVVRRTMAKAPHIDIMRSPLGRARGLGSAGPEPRIGGPSASPPWRWCR